MARRGLAQLDCPVQAAALDWWIRTQGIADLNNPDYLALAPYLQLALDDRNPGAARFIYVGRQSLPAEMLGKNFTSAVHAGQWWDDGGYAEAVSEAYEETSELGEPILEEIQATICLPSSGYAAQTVALHYDRLCLPTAFTDGQRTITVVASQHRTMPKKSNVIPLHSGPRNQ